MAYFTVVQADAFYGAKAPAPAAWATSLQKAVYLEMASARLDALPWLTDWDTQAERTADAGDRGGLLRVGALLHRTGRIGKPGNRGNFRP